MTTTASASGATPASAASRSRSLTPAATKGSADTQPATLAAALAKLQTHLPRIGKDKTAKVTSARTGKTHTYDYANLATVSREILPMLGELGLSFSCTPTIADEGALVLNYVLRHTSGESAGGLYPLPASGSPQEIGSAITYAPRYCLLAVTCAAPHEDD